MSTPPEPEETGGKAYSSNDPAGPGPEEPPAADPAVITGTLLAGLLVWGGVGWILARWLDNDLYLMAGIVTGAAASLYLVWLRYGRQR